MIIVDDTQDDGDHLGVESDRTLVDVLPVVALSRLHVDHLVMRKITTLNILQKDGTWSQYSSVSKRKVQLNLGTPLHRISCGILFLT